MAAVKKTTEAKKEYTFAVGRRREAVARVRLYEFVKDGLTWEDLPIKKGDILVNKKAISEYFGGEVNRFRYTEPLRVANAQNKYTITISVAGGGPSGQLDAVVAGISNALAKADAENFRPILKEKGFLTRDARIRERRMVGTGGKSRRKKQSPKR
ncbi:MAG: small subunit ribosomal protein [Patescibacteria group bacterium]|jgi:small subunit ribosomal protein S9|nr:small subunit ribosomal protein [Patescibacteria group bacterium]